MVDDLFIDIFDDDSETGQNIDGTIPSGSSGESVLFDEYSVLTHNRMRGIAEDCWGRVTHLINPTSGVNTRNSKPPHVDVSALQLVSAS